jgi:hypothetical protein
MSKCSTGSRNDEREQPSGEWAEPLPSTQMPASTARQSGRIRLVDLFWAVVLCAIALIGAWIRASSH